MLEKQLWVLEKRLWVLEKQLLVLEKRLWVLEMSELGLRVQQQWERLLVLERLPGGPPQMRREMGMWRVETRPMRLFWGRGKLLRGRSVRG